MAAFFPGVTPILTSGAVVGPEEKKAMHDAVDLGWVTGGIQTEKFEKGLAEYTGHKYALACNSGSSANLIAVATMVALGLWKKGDEIICVAASFPTTVNPLLLYGLVPVFIDITLPTFAPNMTEMEAAITSKTKGMMIAHTIGIPYDLDHIGALCEMHGLSIVEDCCDALGSYYKGQHVGHLGVVSTTSFYPAHHISTGEGGAVFVNTKNAMVKARSIRDWGRSCYCGSGEENACGARFNQQLGTLPFGFDHKYTYSHVGFNLKMPEIPAAMGVVQLTKLKDFGEARRINFQRLKTFVEGTTLKNEVTYAEATPESDPSWFGFPIVLRRPNLRRELQIFLEQRKIGTRLVFGGNLLKQPYMQGQEYRVASPLVITDHVMHNALWLGVYPGMTEPMLDYIGKSLLAFFAMHPEAA